MTKEKALMLAEVEEENRRKLAKATLTELELTEEVTEASQSVRDALSEPNAHSQSVKFVWLTKWVTNVSTKVANQSQVQDSSVENETRQGSLMRARSDSVTEIGRTNTTPPFFSVPYLTSLKQPSINHAQYSLQPDGTQPQTEPSNPDTVSKMAQQIATLKSNSSFAVPVNHV